MLIPCSSEQPARHCLAILIGIDEYTNGVPRLRNAVRDVQAVAQVLREEHSYDTHLLLNEQATLAGLRALLSQLPTEISMDTRLVLYFAGHGIAEETDEDATGPHGFLIPQDARRDDLATFLPMTEVQAVLSKLPCKHLLLLLDCCFAGAFRWSQTRSIRVRPTTLFRERYERYLRDPAWQVITSAASDERALDAVAGGKLGRRGEGDDISPFAAALCRGLRGAADLRVDGQPGDGVIVANELHVYLESAFERLEQQLKRTMQKPLLWSLSERDKGQFIFFTPGRAIALPSALELSESNNPYRGLEPYDEKNAALFFGRKEVIEQLCRQVQTKPLTVVSGVSGSGKSSVVRAGLMSRLRNSSDWHILPLVRPGSAPLFALASVNSSLEVPAQSDFLAAVASWRARNAGTQLLLVIDQLEELLTLGATPSDQQRFLDHIFNALSESGGQLHVVMTLRSDFEPHFSELLISKPGTQVRFLLRPLNRQELRQVIEGPASERVLYFEPAMLVDQLIDEVAEMPGALPLLSFTMSELYRAYVRSGRSDRYLTATDYQRLNGVAGALSQRADEIFNSLDTAHQGALRRVMLRMVVLEAGERARRRVPMDELRYGDGHPEEQRVQTVLRLLQDARLIVSGIDSENIAYVEPAHDQLVLGWQKLWSFIQAEQATIPVHRLLTQEAVTWAQKERKNEHLWFANPRLPFIVELQKTEAERFNALENEFIRKSELHRVQKLDEAVNVAHTILVIADRKLKPIAGAAQVRKELLALGRKLLESLGAGAQGNAGVRSTQAAALVHQADLLLTNGDTQQLAQAQQLYEASLVVRDELAEADPTNAEWQRDLSVTYSKLGNVLKQAGKLPEATAHYEQSLALFTKLLEADPTNADWQHNLAVSYRNLGEVLKQAGKLPEAMARYEQSLARFTKLLEADPTNAPWQRDMAVSCDNLGEVLKRAGKLPEATARYEQSLALSKRLADADPSNAEWQCNLATSYWKLSEVLKRAGKLPEAMAHCEQSLALSKRLADADPSNAEFQYNLAVCYWKLGEVLKRAERLPEATARYELSLSLFTKLAEVDPTNAYWQGGVAVSYWKLGEVLKQAGKLPEATVHCEQSLALSKKLAGADPTNAEFQHNLAESHGRLGEVLEQVGKLPEAMSHYAQSLTLLTKLAEAHPGNTGLLFDRLWRHLAFLRVARLRQDPQQIRSHLTAADMIVAQLEREGLFVTDANLIGIRTEIQEIHQQYSLNSKAQH